MNQFQTGQELKMNKHLPATNKQLPVISTSPVHNPKSSLRWEIRDKENKTPYLHIFINKNYPTMVEEIRSSELDIEIVRAAVAG